MKLKVIYISIVFIILLILLYILLFQSKGIYCFYFDYSCRYKNLLNRQIELELFESKNSDNYIKDIKSKYSDKGMQEYLFSKAIDLYGIKYFNLDFVLRTINKEKYLDLIKQNKIKSFDEIYN